MKQVAAAYQPGATLGSAFRKLLEQTLKGLGLLFLDPLAAPIREVAAPFLSEAVQRVPELLAALRARNAAISAAGYHTQVHIDDDSSLFFLLKNGRRWPVRWKDGQVQHERRFLQRRRNGRHGRAAFAQRFAASRDARLSVANCQLCRGPVRDCLFRARRRAVREALGPHARHLSAQQLHFAGCAREQIAHSLQTARSRSVRSPRKRKRRLRVALGAAGPQRTNQSGTNLRIARRWRNCRAVCCISIQHSKPPRARARRKSAISSPNSNAKLPAKQCAATNMPAKTPQYLLNSIYPSAPLAGALLFHSALLRQAWSRSAAAIARGEIQLSCPDHMLRAF